jgi:hypothetical protein
MSEESPGTSASLVPQGTDTSAGPIRSINLDGTDKYNSDKDTTIIISLASLPNFGEGKKQLCYKDVEMPAKLYGRTQNIEDHVDEKVPHLEHVGVAWQRFVKTVDLDTMISNNKIKEFIIRDFQDLNEQGNGFRYIHFATVKDIFDTYGKKGKESDLLTTNDRYFLHLLVNYRDFFHVTNPEITIYSKKCNCLSQTIRIIEKYSKNRIVNTDAMRNYSDPRPNRRFNEMLIFISHYFGRMELVFGESVVMKVFNNLTFVHDFTLGIEEQAIAWEKKEKEKNMRATDAGNDDVDSDLDSNAGRAKRRRSTSSPAKGSKAQRTKGGKGNTPLPAVNVSTTFIPLFLL